MKVTKTNAVVVSVALFLVVFPFVIELVISSSYRPIPLIISLSALVVFLTVAFRKKMFKKPKTAKDRLVGALAGGGGVLIADQLTRIYWDPFGPFELDALFIVPMTIGVLLVVSAAIIHYFK
jgi:hypothetical protein